MYPERDTMAFRNIIVPAHSLMPDEKVAKDKDAIPACWEGNLIARSAFLGNHYPLASTDFLLGKNCVGTAED